MALPRGATGIDSRVVTGARRISIRRMVVTIYLFYLRRNSQNQFASAPKRFWRLTSPTGSMVRSIKLSEIGSKSCCHQNYPEPRTQRGESAMKVALAQIDSMTADVHMVHRHRKLFPVNYASFQEAKHYAPGNTSLPPTLSRTTRMRCSCVAVLLGVRPSGDQAFGGGSLAGIGQDPRTGFTSRKAREARR